MKESGKLRSSHIWTIVGISLIVAIFASFATLSITGNVIKVKTDNSLECTKICTYSCKNATVGNTSISCYNKCYNSCIGSAPLADVYTKGEIDTKLSQLKSNLNSELRYGEGSITYDMLARLNKCEIVKDNQEKGVISCDEVCKKAVSGTICVLGESQGTIRSCSDNTGSINTDRFCKCCGI